MQAGGEEEAQKERPLRVAEGLGLRQFLDELATTARIALEHGTQTRAIHTVHVCCQRQRLTSAVGRKHATAVISGCMHLRERDAVGIACA